MMDLTTIQNTDCQSHLHSCSLYFIWVKPGEAAGVLRNEEEVLDLVQEVGEVKTEIGLYAWLVRSRLDAKTVIGKFERLLDGSESVMVDTLNGETKHFGDFSGEGATYFENIH